MRGKRVGRAPFLWAVAAAAAVLLSHLVATLVEELPRLIEGLK